jgi:hypothetical protein
MRWLHYSAVVALSLVCTLTMAGVSHAQTGVQCDGSNDYITFGSAPELGATAFTLELWFYKTGLSSVTSTGSGGVSAVPLLTKGRSENDGSNVDMNYFLAFAARTTCCVPTTRKATVRQHPAQPSGLRRHVNSQ